LILIFYIGFNGISCDFLYFFLWDLMEFELFFHGIQWNFSVFFEWDLMI